MTAFEQKVLEVQKTPLQSLGIDTVQVSIGLSCNQQCAHCHVCAGPGRFERMEWATLERVRDLARQVNCKRVDITGGAPELHPNLRRFIQVLRQEGFRVQVRTNLTIFFELNTENFPEFYREWGVELAASLPCTTEANVKAQRGEGVFGRSITALWRLNALGYGQDPALPLNLVHNPEASALPSDPALLEQTYRRDLEQRFGITFTRLYTHANMPIGKFLFALRRRNQEHAYRSRLQNNFNPETLDRLMCRRQLTVGWDGTLYDCDFNLALGRPIAPNAVAHIRKIDVEALQTRAIRTGDHCFGCTAGQRSTCALTAQENEGALQPEVFPRDRKD